MRMERILREKRVVVCCGSGGVGKTTTAAALALRAAVDGRRTLVLTIDPAKRLANALGFDEFRHEEQLVSADLMRRAGLTPRAELRAMMLDVGGTFDAIIDRYAPSTEVRDRILQNKLYKNLAATLAGSQEYMAMEKLYDRVGQGEYDLIVLDTPPTRNALDFLDAPRRMVDFLDESVLKWFLIPYVAAGKMGLNLLRRGGEKILHTLERITGSEFIRDISDFFQAFEGMYEGFRDRATHVVNLLEDPGTIFLLVTSPTEVAIDEAVYFYQKLREYNFAFSTFIVNRVHTAPYGDDASLEDASAELRALLAAAGASAEVLRSLLNSGRALHTLAARDRAGLARLRRAVVEEEVDYRLVPALNEDVHDLHGLAQIGGAIMREKCATPPPL
jgi:anion-transporting  ArsA/GET3 family ATPase